MGHNSNSFAEWGSMNSCGNCYAYKQNSKEKNMYKRFFTFHLICNSLIKVQFMPKIENLSTFSNLKKCI